MVDNQTNQLAIKVAALYLKKENERVNVLQKEIDQMKNDLVIEGRIRCSGSQKIDVLAFRTRTPSKKERRKSQRNSFDQRTNRKTRKLAKAKDRWLWVSMMIKPMTLIEIVCFILRMMFNLDEFNCLNEIKSIKRISNWSFDLCLHYLIVFGIEKWEFSIC